VEEVVVVVVRSGSSTIGSGSCITGGCSSSKICRIQVFITVF
jgi:hypothetical protein